MAISVYWLVDGSTTLIRAGKSQKLFVWMHSWSSEDFEDMTLEIDYEMDYFLDISRHSAASIHCIMNV